MVSPLDRLMDEANCNRAVESSGLESLEHEPESSELDVEPMDDHSVEAETRQSGAALESLTTKFANAVMFWKRWTLRASRTVG